MTAETNFEKFPINSECYVMDLHEQTRETIFKHATVLRYTKTRIIVAAVVRGTMKREERAFNAEDLFEVGSWTKARDSYSYVPPKLVTKEGSVIPRLEAKLQAVRRGLTTDYVLRRLKHDLDMACERDVPRMLEKELKFFMELQQERQEISTKLMELKRKST